MVLPEAWQEESQLATFEKLWRLSGEVYRAQPGRKTFRYKFQNQNYFIKLHSGVGWLEIIKNLSFGRLPILGARNEWQALQALPKLPVDTLELVGYGERGVNPARKQSFVITKELTGVISLEQLCQDWAQQPPLFHDKVQLIRKVASVARSMHQAGINHRDFYLCHFLLQQGVALKGAKLYLIDLHRAQMRRKVPLRWQVKDLAGLYFSALDCGLTQRDVWRFIYYYQDGRLKVDGKLPVKLWQTVQTKAYKLYRKVHGKSYGT